MQKQKKKTLSNGQLIVRRFRGRTVHNMSMLHMAKKAIEYSIYTSAETQLTEQGAGGLQYTNQFIQELENSAHNIYKGASKLERLTYAARLVAAHLDGISVDVQLEKNAVIDDASVEYIKEFAIKQILKLAHENKLAICRDDAEMIWAAAVESYATLENRFNNAEDVYHNTFRGVFMDMPDIGFGGVECDGCRYNLYANTDKNPLKKESEYNLFWDKNVNLFKCSYNPWDCPVGDALCDYLGNRDNLEGVKDLPNQLCFLMKKSDPDRFKIFMDAANKFRTNVN